MSVTDYRPDPEELRKLDEFVRHEYELIHQSLDRIDRNAEWIDKSFDLDPQSIEDWSVECDEIVQSIWDEYRRILNRRATEFDTVHMTDRVLFSIRELRSACERIQESGVNVGRIAETIATIKWIQNDIRTELDMDI